MREFAFWRCSALTEPDEFEEVSALARRVLQLAQPPRLAEPVLQHLRVPEVMACVARRPLMWAWPSPACVLVLRAT